MLQRSSRVNTLASSFARRRWFYYLPSEASRDRQRCCCVHTEAGTGHYYDSQSGRHVPIHDEAKITAYYHPSGRPSATEILDHAKSLGLAGALIMSDDDGRKCIEDIKASSFGGTVFLSSQLAAEENTQQIGANVAMYALIWTHMKTPMTKLPLRKKCRGYRELLHVLGKHPLASLRKSTFQTRSIRS